MNRCVFLVLAGLAMVALHVPAASAASSPAGPHQVRPLSRSSSLEPSTSAPISPKLAAQAQLRTLSPLGIISDGPCTVTGRVLNYDGTALGGVGVDWGLWTGTTYTYGNTTTAAADGSFSFTGVRETSDGDIAAYYKTAAVPTAYTVMESWGNVFTAAGPNDVTIRPGIVQMVLDRDESGWNNWKYASMNVYSTKGYARSYDTDASWAYALAMPPDCQSIVVRYWVNQGAEWFPSLAMPITPGETASGPSLSQDQAARLYLTKPYWLSGRPGSSVTMRLERWPLGSGVGFYGYSEDPASTTVKQYSAIHNGGSPESKTLTIPSTATPGYAFQLHARRVDLAASRLDLWDYFQVCTLKSSKISVRAGGTIKLSGVIPTEGHWGSEPGKVKYVTLYKRTKAAGAAPTAWDATKQGWTKVGAFTASAFGKYSRYLHPKRTTWYVVRYPGDSWYWGAFTSVLKVRVY